MTINPLINYLKKKHNQETHKLDLIIHQIKKMKVIANKNHLVHIMNKEKKNTGKTIGIKNVSPISITTQETNILEKIKNQKIEISSEE